MPSIEYIKDHCVHVFECTVTCCMGKVNGCMVRQYLDTGDVKSMSNLCKHAKICWGEEAVAAADNTWDVWSACEALGKLKSVDRSITAAFEQVAKSKVTYSHRQHTSTKAWYIFSLQCILNVLNMVTKHQDHSLGCREQASLPDC